jgi:hypothetical protein
VDVDLLVEHDGHGNSVAQAHAWALRAMYSSSSWLRPGKMVNALAGRRRGPAGRPSPKATSGRHQQV